MSAESYPGKEHIGMVIRYMTIIRMKLDIPRYVVQQLGPWKSISVMQVFVTTWFAQVLTLARRTSEKRKQY